MSSAWAGWSTWTNHLISQAKKHWPREKENGSRYVLAKLEIDGNKPAKDSYIFDKRKKFAGTVTSACWSPSAKANIALASLEVPHGKVGDELVAEIYYQRELKWSRVMGSVSRY